MAVLLHSAGNTELLRARLGHDASRRSVLQQWHESVGPRPHLLDDFTSAVSNARLTIAAAQVDADMLHDLAPIGPSIKDRRWTSATSSFLIKLTLYRYL